MEKSEKIEELERVIGRDYGNIAGLVVRKDGETRYEAYWNGYTATRPVHVFSVTKSVVSALVGIAIDRGYIEGVDQKVLAFFPGYTVKRGEKTIQRITLRNLLTMTAPYKFKSAPYTKVFTNRDWVKASLDLLDGKKHIGVFRYMEMIGPDILSGILVNATGRPVLDFAREALFSPLGITAPSPIVLATPALHTAFIKTNNASGWVADENGTNTAGWGLTLTATDMAKIGQLYLNGGSWEGRRIVSAEWVRESTTEQSRWKEEGLSYGYCWWTGLGDGYAALGNSGNVIYVNPKKRMVCAIASLFQPNAGDRLKLIQNVIEPAFEGGETVSVRAAP